MNPKRVIFAGTPDFAATALQAVIAAGYDIPLVLTQPDRPKGRGMKIKPGPVRQVALDAGLNTAAPVTLRDASVQDMLRDIGADVMVVAAYGLLLPPDVLAIPRLGCLNIHASLLPRWRGAAPIQRAIEAGDNETGVCIMKMEAGLDTGPVAIRSVYPILPDDTAQSVQDALARLGAQAVTDALADWDRLVFTPQCDSGATYAKKLTTAETVLDWSLPAEILERRIRAFNPAPGARTFLNGSMLKILQAHVEPAPDANANRPGCIIESTGKTLKVATGTNDLVLDTVQPAGSRPMPAAAFLAGNTLPVGSCFGAGA